MKCIWAAMYICGGAGRAADAGDLAVSLLGRGLGNAGATIARRGMRGRGTVRVCDYIADSRLETNETARAVVWAPQASTAESEAQSDVGGY